MAYRFLEGITVADVAFEATGKTVDELFSSAAEATTATMVKDVRSIEKKVKKDVTLSAPSLEQLLHDFLEELIYLKDADMLLFSEWRVSVQEPSAQGEWRLHAVIEGEVLDAGKHELLVDVKAVTWHQFSVNKSAQEYRATVVLDV